MPNTHRAFAMVDSCVLTKPYTGEEVRVEFDQPKHKLIASGSVGYCTLKAVEYFKKHGCETGVLEYDKPGNPWESEWAGVERMAK